MNAKDVLNTVESALASFRTPAAAATAAREVREIDRNYCANGVTLPINEAASLILDAALLSDTAFMYFLPDFARAAFSGAGDPFLLWRRLQRVSRSDVMPVQQEALQLLSIELSRIEDELESSERELVDRAKSEWREELRASPSPNNRLLLAAELGDATGVERALADGADVSYQDAYGNSAVSLARVNQHMAVLRVLDEHDRHRQ